MKIIVAASIKGGVGKTSTAVFLAQALVTRGHNVLAVDGDHNNNLTDFFLRDVIPKPWKLAMSIMFFQER